MPSDLDKDIRSSDRIVALAAVDIFKGTSRRIIWRKNQARPTFSANIGICSMIGKPSMLIWQVKAT